MAEARNGRPGEIVSTLASIPSTPLISFRTPRSEAGRLDQTLKAMKGRSVLTVTDITGAERRGAIIVLVNDNNRIRMRINVAAAKASNLVISSKLLRPAEVVGNDGG